ncbi:putative dynein light intermediate chain protein [Botrytis fragariae]|uniref:Putative dynein light intermediate chain protein n=1 Tax=Botrytis fragariae TaxID=1964551 RepID=A0A8H6B193_9HELO|nr:putative dynein light intermediate chain protein [Botrytis fragariae]KAF5877539.1 putative dynein light intermediate chain protein [Botrytis fragariae]
MANNRASTYTQATTSTEDEEKKDMWSSMLDGVASGKRLPEKNILVLGGTADSQKEFLEALSVDETRKSQDRQSSKQPPIANNFALGYTYHDVLDADHEDILARLSLYLLADPSPSFTPLMQPLLTPQTIPNTLIVILLDWSQPWFWLRELRDWIRLLRPLLISLDEDCKEKMEEVMISWRDRGRGGSTLDGGGSTATEGDVSLPLGPGEWEEALGLPLCVVCQNSDKIETLEKERSWREDEFDYVLQYLRTILLKHGASLIYTTPGVISPLQGLIHSSLGIHSLLKRQPIRHNLIDRDKVVVPPNWDSWGKIRVLREGFNVEEVNKGWSLDIEEDSSSDDSSTHSQPPLPVPESAVSAYEEVIRDPSLDALQATSAESQGLKLEVSSLDAQSFLASQVEILHTISQGPDVSSVDSSRLVNGRKVSSEYGNGEDKASDEGRVSEHIGPVQFNMGGIQVDADDMLQRLRDRQAYSSPESAAPGTRTDPSAEGKVQNEALASFFAGLMKRGGSAQGGPKPGASS